MLVHVLHPCTSELRELLDGHSPSWHGTLEASVGNLVEQHTDNLRSELGGIFQGLGFTHAQHVKDGIASFPHVPAGRLAEFDVIKLILGNVRDVRGADEFRDGWHWLRANVDAIGCHQHAHGDVYLQKGFFVIESARELFENIVWERNHARVDF